MTKQLHKVFMPDDVNAKIAGVLNSGQLAYGEFTNKFEQGLKNYVGNEFILTLSGNSVLFALDVLDIKQGDEIISSPMSCLMTNQPIAVKGATVVWADVDPSTGTLTPDDLKSKITSKTKAILHYHWGGNPGHIDEINEIANQHGVVVIEEASTAFGAEYKNKKIGNTNTSIVCFSFTAVRLPNAVNGFGIAFNNEELYKKAILKRDFGINRKEFRDSNGEISSNCDIKIPGLGLVLDNISSLVGYSQLSHIEGLYTKQRENATKWDAYFNKDNNFKSVGNRLEINPNYWVYSLVSDRRDMLYQELKNKGFNVSKLHHRNDSYGVFKDNQKDVSTRLTGVDEFERTQLNLPCGWWLEDNDFKF
ncbi:hypothetical protein BTO05_08585 [Winogradskyella sp. PC-19]|uniref:aminotransferase class V-fold PLP-dependent enzyme n=1 Tax=Winogradskyella sp. PC-19 TaxID=754417 RepID=UPI000B3C70B1|nr:aminotransferase class V-fold PLP-dependent enzyme [Winogradskyella sp. PC-19]ARV09695.1 hypothetical protein BTO05_08585 [Winogradskyella sp. PC-19]